MRAFAAIDLPEALRAELGRRQALFRSSLVKVQEDGNIGVRWVHPEGIHLTLKFLGELPEIKSAQVIAALSALGAFPRFNVEIQGFGFFPDSRKPRVFWVGVIAPPSLAELAARVDAAMAKLGFSPEKRNFSPHLTLARFNTTRPQASLESLARECGASSIGQFEVHEFSLFESRLRAGAPAEYRKLACFP